MEPNSCRACSGLPAQNVQAYPGQSPVLQQQHELDLSNATEERAVFSSAAGSGDTVIDRAGSSGDASAAQQQVLADVATKPKAPVDEGMPTTILLIACHLSYSSWHHFEKHQLCCFERHRLLLKVVRIDAPRHAGVAITCMSITLWAPVVAMRRQHHALPTVAASCIRRLYCHLTMSHSRSFRPL